MKTIESDLENKCCDYARKLGVAAVKLEKNGNKGIPDRLFIKNGGSCMFVEFKKSATEKLKPEQLYWSEFLGTFCHTVWNFERFKELIDDFVDEYDMISGIKLDK